MKVIIVWNTGPRRPVLSMNWRLPNYTTIFCMKVKSREKLVVIGKSSQLALGASWTRNLRDVL